MHLAAGLEGAAGEGLQALPQHGAAVWLRAAAGERRKGGARGRLGRRGGCGAGHGEDVGGRGLCLRDEAVHRRLRLALCAGLVRSTLVAACPHVLMVADQF